MPMDTYKKVYLVKVERRGKYWIFYLKDGSGLIILPIELCYGELPPIRLFPWQYHELEIEMFDDFISKASLDGLVLFSFKKNNVPQSLKNVVFI